MLILDVYNKQGVCVIRVECNGFPGCKDKYSDMGCT